jgi:hypothetical protein
MRNYYNRQDGERVMLRASLAKETSLAISDESRKKILRWMTILAKVGTLSPRVKANLGAIRRGTSVGFTY